MILEYLYTNNAWGKTRVNFLFDIDNKKVYWSNNLKTDNNLIEIAGIEPEEQSEMLFYISKIKHLNLFNIKFINKGGGFDAGCTQYFLILDSKTKIKLGEKGDSIKQAENPDINNLTKLIDKYVGLAEDILK